MPLTPQANAIVNDFGRQPGVQPEQQQSLRQAIERSPYLMDEMNRAVAEGRLTHFRLQPAGTNSEGNYDPGTRIIELKPEMLDKSDSLITKNDREALTNTLGHEVRHALNARHMESARATFDKEIEQVASSPQRDHDYTAPIDKMLRENLRDEATAEISGWNANLSAMQKEFADAKRPPPTLEDIYRNHSDDASEFIDLKRVNGQDVFTLKPNIQLNHDLSMPESDRNIQGITDNILTRPSLGLGERGTSEYRNNYGADLISEAVKMERAYNSVPQPGRERPEMSLDMAKLGLNRQTLEENGLSLGAGNLPMPYVDKSTNPPTRSQFHDTRDSHEFVPSKPPVHNPTRLDDAAHPDHAMFQQARGHVHALDRQLGRTPDQHSDNLAAAVTVSARADGLNRIDQVALSTDGSKLFAVQTPRGARDHFFDKQTSVPTAAANTPMEQSAAQWPQAMQGYQQQQAQSQAPAQQQQAEVQQQSGPVQQLGGR